MYRVNRIIERMSREVESEIIQAVRIGQYHVQGVPHIALSTPTSTGEMVIREAYVDLKLARIYVRGLFFKCSLGNM